LAGKRNIYSKEFRQAAVRRVRGGESRAAVARDLGVSDVAVGKWCRFADNDELDELACTAERAAHVGWERRRCDIAARWQEIAAECQSEALKVLHRMESGCGEEFDNLRKLFGTSPVKALITTAAIATDKVMLMNNEATERTEMSQEVRTSAADHDFDRLHDAVVRAGPSMDDPVFDDLMDQLEAHLLGQAAES